MTLHDWIYSVYPPDAVIQGQWGTLHILTLVCCIGAIVGLAFLGRARPQWKMVILYILAGIIFAFEVTRRVINLTRGEALNGTALMRILLPRPWCAISCWMAMASIFVKKKWFYNVVSTNGILCALVFFAYPAVGFNHRVILFENLYSIGTHTLLLMFCVLLICFGMTDFRYQRGMRLGESAIWELISLLCVNVYAFVEIYLLKIEADPLYFMPGNDVQEVLGCTYPVYLVIYVCFLAFYFNAYYLVTLWVTKRKKTPKDLLDT